MPKLYVDGNPRMVACVLEDGGSAYMELNPHRTSMEAEYVAVIFGLNFYYSQWNKELDARQDDRDPETNEFTPVGSPADKTIRPLPRPVLVCSDNETVVKQLSREYHIGADNLRKLAQQVWQMCNNVEVKFQWVSRKENPAGKMLK